MLFGEYLIDCGLIGEGPIIAALDYQRKQVPFVGEVAVRLGYLTARDVLRLLHLQTVTDERILTIARKENFLNDDQVSHILKTQRDALVPLGEILLQRELIDAQALKEAIKNYSRRVIGDRDSTSLSNREAGRFLGEQVPVEPV